MSLDECLTADLAYRQEPLELDWDDLVVEALVDDEPTREHAYTSLELSLSAIAEEQR